MLKTFLATLFVLIANVAIAQPSNDCGGSPCGPGPVPPTSTFVQPTGGTVPRTPNAIAGDTINPLFYNPGGGAVDITGNTDAQPAINAAIIQACATNSIRTKSLHIPPGKYLFNNLINLPANCSNLTINADPGSVTWIASVLNNPSNSNVVLLLQWGTGNDNIKVEGIIFDGNTLGGNTNTNGLLRVNGAARNPSWVNNEFIHSAGNGTWVVSELHITAGTLAIESEYLDTVFTFNAPLPASVKMGAYILGGHINPGYYITGLTTNTITVQKPLDDTQFINSPIQVTPAFNVSTDAKTGDTVLLTTNTLNLKPQQTVYHDLVKCLVPGTRILSVATNVSVTLDTPLPCPITAGSNIAAISGIPNLLVQGNRFFDLGQQFRNGAIATYTTAASATSGAISLTFNCFSGRNCQRVGPIPGNFTASTGMPTGMPASNPINAQVSINANAGTFTLSFKNPITADIPSGTPIPFTVGINTGKGYAVWAAAGEYWSTPGYHFLNNTYENTWATPLFVTNTLGAVMENDKYYMNYNEFNSASSVAASGCSGGINNVGQIVQFNYCSGSNGAGMEFDHNINLTVRGNYITGCAFDGIGISGGYDLKLLDNTIINCGQYVNYPITQSYTKYTSTGIQLSGSITAGRIGALNGLIINNLSANDNQVTPTQNYGLAMSNHNSLLLNAQYGLLTTLGNAILPSDPALNINPPPPGTINLIVNPCMAVDQSNEGGIVATSVAYGPDQWQTLSAPNNVHYQRTTTAQNGCVNSLKMFVNTTASLSNPTDLNYINQPLEIGNLIALKYGTIAAASTVVDFCAKTTTPGTYGWGIQSHFPGVGLKSYASSYTTTGTTSQCFSFIVPGDTVTGFPASLTGEALSLSFDAGSGSNYYAPTPNCLSWQLITANTNYFCSTGINKLSTQAPGQAIEITAVRFYPGTTDAPWVGTGAAAPPYTTQRYFGKTFPVGIVPAQNAGTSGANCDSYDNMVSSFPLTPGFDWNYPQEMRIPPAIVTYNTNAANSNWRDTTANNDVVATINVDGLQDNDQVLIGAASVTPSTDKLCIHATANARF